MKQRKLAASAALMVVCLFAGASRASGQVVPAPWTSADIGNPKLSGSASYSNGVFDIDAAGADVWGTKDEFHFVYQQISGDVDVRLRVDSITRVQDASRAGIMIRGSLSNDAPHAYSFVTAGSGVNFFSRKAQGATTAWTGGPQLNAPTWVRLVRTGTTLTAYSSADGTTWTAYASDTIALGANAYVGIAVNSRAKGKRTNVKVSNVSVSGGSSTTPPPDSNNPPPPTPPAGQLPAGQTAADIGSPAIAGSTSYSSGKYTIKAAGNDIWQASDQFHFVYQPVDGDVEVIARVASITNVDKWSKAGVMIRESLAADSAFVMALASSKKGYSLRWRQDAGAAAAQRSATGGTPPGWVRLVRKGTSVTGYWSSNGTTWTSLGSTTVPMNTTVYVGIAANSRNPAAATTAVVDGLKIVGSTSSSNKPPTVVLSAPTNGATYKAPATVTLTASAADSDGTVASVEFYANGTLVGKDTAAPFTVVGTLQQGTYAITAVAYDNAGASTVSGTVNITVSGTTQPAPTPAPTGVAFTASTTHSSVTHYMLEIHKSGQTPGSTAATATSNLGKPAVNSSGDIVVDLTSFFQGLPAGNYIATVVAKNSTSSARSSAVAFTR